MGIEPTTTAWKAVVLPLNYARILGELNSPLSYNSIFGAEDQMLRSKNLVIAGLKDEKAPEQTGKSKNRVERIPVVSARSLNIWSSAH